VTFDEYLIRKKIDKVAFSQHEPSRFAEWASEFNLIHPNSFTLQKLHLINAIRRKYQLKNESKPLSS
jgi:hypothetical protein